MSEPYMVIGDLYNRIFASQSSHIDVLVNYAVWNRIFEKLPKEYLLPDLEVLTF
ncbi:MULTISPECIES: hypothetical protein [Paenibacillus]|uniref:Uncharacterized protein n=1 Tax=Paenibacillus albilobatus TaxID=2716884 RepID=A0A920CBT4_9BACL|nr:MULTISPECIES: hypothetical protein [Paenibacillus]GIO33775.1 hypothetical protein J2TS6_49160 [Paenibacillus albilobatus]